MNKYITKISSDLSIAEKSKDEEEKAIQDYTKRLEVANNPILKKAIEHARKEEKDHARDFEKAEDSIEKKAMLVQQYKHSKTGETKWWHEGQPTPSTPWHPIKGHTTYIKLSGKNKGKTTKEIARGK